MIRPSLNCGHVIPHNKELQPAFSSIKGFLSSQPAYSIELPPMTNPLFPPHHGISGRQASARIEAGIPRASNHPPLVGAVVLAAPGGTLLEHCRVDALTPVQLMLLLATGAAAWAARRHGVPADMTEGRSDALVLDGWSEVQP